MLDTLSNTIDQLCLEINVENSCYLIFGIKKCSRSSTITLLGKDLVCVQSSVYLGYVFSGDLSIDHDVDRMMDKFLKCFNSFPISDS